MAIDLGYNYAYMYGLSDFWVTVFEDPELNKTLLAGSTAAAAEVYNRFLQLTSAMSLEDVSLGTHSDIKLILLDVESVGPSDRTFKLPENIVSCKVISDRPFLPLKSLEEGVDYEIKDGYVTFAKPLLDSSYRFPYTITETGLWRFALWGSDVVIDEQLISKVYAPLVRVNPDISDNVYKDFVRGLFFLYTNGPNIDFMARGLSLALGIPLARTTETVLLTTQDAQTGRWIVVTDVNSYTLPYTIAPTVAIGDVLSLGDSLAKVIEIQDYKTNQEWWINMYIPRKVIQPSGAVAVAGGAADWLMRTYLKNHTFLVKVNWQPGLSFNGFDQLRDMVSTVRPSYTLGIFTWAVPGDTEDITADDEGVGDFNAIPTVFGEEWIGPRPYIHRGDLSPQSRQSAWFIHGNRDPDDSNTVEGADVVYPPISWGAATYIVGGGPDVTTTYQYLTFLYNTFESEIASKIGVLAPLPNFFTLWDDYVGNYTMLSRDLGSAPGTDTEYYSTEDALRANNMFHTDLDGFSPEINRGFYPVTGVSDPLTLVFMRQHDTSDVFSVYLYKDAGTWGIQRDIPKEEVFTVETV